MQRNRAFGVEVLVGVLLVIGIALFLSHQSKKIPILDKATPKKSAEIQTTSTEVFGTPKKSAHYETNTPSHGSILGAPPINIVIDFNFDLAKPSSILVKKDGKEYGVGETIIDPNKLTLRKNFDPTAPDGRYTVEYNACWPDSTCHDGNFQFDIDSSYKNQYEDNTGNPEVQISMRNLTFQPQYMRIKRGSKVVWMNDDSVDHYVNTDSHPAHSYYKEMNSKVLKPGDAYTLILHNPGEYTYHCSAHTQMTGSIIVE